MKLICNCGQEIPDDNISMTGNTNEEGEEYTSFDAYCDHCKSIFDANCWGDEDSLDEAKYHLEGAYVTLKLVGNDEDNNL